MPTTNVFDLQSVQGVNYPYGASPDFIGNLPSGNVALRYILYRGEYYAVASVDVSIRDGRLVLYCSSSCRGKVVVVIVLDDVVEENTEKESD